MQKKLAIYFKRQWIIAHPTESGGNIIDEIAKALRERFPDYSVEQPATDTIYIHFDADKNSAEEIKKILSDLSVCSYRVDESIESIDLGDSDKENEEETPKEDSGEDSDGELGADEPVPDEEDESEEEAKRREERRKRIAETLERLRNVGDAFEEDEDGHDPVVEEGKELAYYSKEAEELSEALNEKIKGQRHAVSEFAEGMFGIRMFGNEGKGPRGLFLFAGPPGVGKTYLAETAAKMLKYPYLRVDMSEFSDKESGSDFNGVHPSYKSAHAGHVTGFVDEHPHCVLLFDEVEKAHVSILHLFLQILERGALRDIFMDKEVSFRDTIIIMTTNAGKNLYEDPEKNLVALTSKTVLNALKTDVDPVTQRPFFPAPIVSRMSAGSIVMFNHLEPFSLREITAAELNSKLKELSERSKLETEADENVATAILYSLGGASDARSLKGAVHSLVRRELLDVMRHIPKNYEEGKIKHLKVSVDLENASDAIRNMFVAEKPVGVLVFGGEEIKKKFSRLRNTGVKFYYTDTVKRAKEYLKRDVDCVFLDVTCGERSVNVMVADLEDGDSAGMDLFRYLNDYHAEVPVYILNTDDIDGDSNSFLSFIRRGARDVFDVRKGADVKGQIRSLSSGVLMSAVSRKLARSSQVLSYNCKQIFDPEQESAEICLSAFALKRAVDAEDSDSVIADIKRPDVKFSDVIGAKEAKKALKIFIDALKDPSSVRGRMPRGVLLYGAPGTGKTLLAKAMAGESDVAFIQKNSTEFFKQYVGEGPRAVRELFKTARRYAPAIIFLDEVDAFAKMRTGSDTTASDEKILNTFLSEMDGFIFDEKRPVFILAATNYEIEESSGSPRLIDPAFSRRFDRKIRLELPDTDDREEFLRYYFKKNGVEMDGAALRNIAVRSYGKSPADLEMIVEHVLRRSAKPTPADLDGAFEDYCYGEEREWDKEAVKKTAYHEAGHTVINCLFGGKPAYVTIVSRGNFGGYMLRGDEKKFGYTRNEILENICCCLGGRAAEIVCYGEEAGISTGASEDLASATRMAKGMICDYGMLENHLASLTGRDREAPIGSPLYTEINKILTEQLNRTVSLLKEHKNVLSKLAEQLLEKNSLTEEEIQKILGPKLK